MFRTTALAVLIAGTAGPALAYGVVGELMTPNDKAPLASFAEEPAKPCGSGPAGDQIGYALHTGGDYWRIEFPAPCFDSKFDILELKR